MNEGARVPMFTSGSTTSSGRLFRGGEEVTEDALDRGFAVIRPLPTVEIEDGELAVPPLEYASIASRPEPARLI
jgi:hypothetical protein